MMGEAKEKRLIANGNGKSIIDMSIQERSIKEGRREFCSMLSERTLLALLHNMDLQVCGDEELVARAWHLAELQYDEMIRRRSIDTPVTLGERMAMQSVLSEQAAQ